ncbi:T9SS type A sorting domain-containing protein [Wenyingzhuangia aestuarii]|uniref:T9SS type A sorting domain-containing protein n=1 Tax=Wenyingzhuangia aestuarii TaxID=1647582 RepID=UPI001439E234|nr:T9SS type A sorting domain-containing protein [Wenyingzhuangia aestuarii]NJB84176.1 hypothetical protein [Wenyingzhuangia aestuarii]
MCCQSSHSCGISVIFNGNEYSFDKELVVEGLSPGTYDGCVTIKGKEYKKCFQVHVKESTAIVAEVRLEQEVAVFNVHKGTKPYKIKVNNEIVLLTESNSFSIEVKQGDLLQVETSKVCEGLFNEKILYKENELNLYPNPAKESVTVNFGEELKNSQVLLIYDTKGLLAHQQKVPKGIKTIQIPITSFKQGVYCLILTTSNGTKTKKLVVR